MSEPDAKTPLEAAITHFGNQSKLAEAIGWKQQMISYYATQPDKKVPAEMAVAIEQKTDGKIARWMLRPDLFDAPSGVANA